jgi:hypothetical protein
MVKLEIGGCGCRNKNDAKFRSVTENTTQRELTTYLLVFSLSLINYLRIRINNKMLKVSLNYCQPRKVKCLDEDLSYKLDLVNEER